MLNNPEKSHVSSPLPDLLPRAEEDPEAAKTREIFSIGFFVSGSFDLSPGVGVRQTESSRPKDEST